jgi:hypothetical protein
MGRLYSFEEMTMKPITPYLGTTQVPNDILAMLARRRLTNSEARLVVAICCHSEKTPGVAQVTIDDLAVTLRTRREVADDLVSHAIKKNIVKRGNSGLGPHTHILTVNAPSTWAVPG